MSNRFSDIGNRRVCEFTFSVVIVRCSPVPFRVEAQILSDPLLQLGRLR